MVVRCVVREKTTPLIPGREFVPLINIPQLQHNPPQPQKKRKLGQELFTFLVGIRAILLWIIGVCLLGAIAIASSSSCLVIR